MQRVRRTPASTRSESEPRERGGSEPRRLAGARPPLRAGPRIGLGGSGLDALAEKGHQALPQCSGQILLSEPAGHLHGASVGVEEGRALLTALEMRLEGSSRGRVQRPIEVLQQQLHGIPASKHRLFPLWRGPGQAPSPADYTSALTMRAPGRSEVQEIPGNPPRRSLPPPSTGACSALSPEPPGPRSGSRDALVVAGLSMGESRRPAGTRLPAAVVSPVPKGGSR